MAKKMLIVFNPLAGKGLIKGKLWKVIDIFIKDNYRVEVHSTQAEGDTQLVAEKYGKKYHLIVVIGGDGTLNEAIRGLMKLDERPLLGYIPAGTTNDFASTLKLSKDILRAAGNIVKGKPFECDIGRFNDKFFTYVAAFGAFTEVSYQTPQPAKNAFGHLAYIFEGMKHLNQIKPYQLRVTINDTFIEDEFIFGMISNSNYIGGIENAVIQNVSLNDGLFELTLIKNPRNAMELQNIIGRFLKRQPDHFYIHTYSTASVVIESDDKVPWTLDGEYGGSYKKTEIQILPDAVTFLK